MNKDTMTVGELRERLSMYPDSYSVTVLGSYNIKNLVMVEKNNHLKIMVKRNG